MYKHNQFKLLMNGIRKCSLIIIYSLLIQLFSVVINLAYSEELAPVSGFVHSFFLDRDLSNAKIKILETGQLIQTDKNNRFGPIQYPVGKPLTLKFQKFGFKTTQTGTIIVPPQGLNDKLNNVTLQIASSEIFYLFSLIVGAHLEADKCHVTTTVTAPGKTLDDIPQGEENAIATLYPTVNEKPFYFGIFKDGKMKDKTNPFSKELTATSLDGGVAFFNVPPSDQPYTISATKPGMSFTSAQFMCRKGAFINISPPRGPMAIK